MQSDLPHVLYNRTSGKPNTKASEEVIRLQEEANRNLAERRRLNGRDETTYDSVNELFNDIEHGEY